MATSSKSLSRISVSIVADHTFFTLPREFHFMILSDLLWTALPNLFRAGKWTLQIGGEFWQRSMLRPRQSALILEGTMSWCLTMLSFLGVPENSGSITKMIGVDGIGVVSSRSRGMKYSKIQNRLCQAREVESLSPFFPPIGYVKACTHAKGDYNRSTQICQSVPRE
jgi:hypothetical protein